MTMCGIAGLYSSRSDLSPALIKRMVDVLRHRGPDDEGYLAAHVKQKTIYQLSGPQSQTSGPRIEEIESPQSLLLGHCRLAIIDLSPAGHQPMANEDHSLWMVYNGEIYNYLEIRKELEAAGHRFRSQTDGEVILHAYEAWQTECLQRFNGMWSFALFDVKKQSLFCARDRAGVKPFYYTCNGETFYFASEIKALLAVPDVQTAANEPRVADYLLSGWVDHTRETFFRSIFQLRPGEFLVFNQGHLSVKPYWDISAPQPSMVDRIDREKELYALLQDSIRLRLRSDVPIGTCLSGGLDSSAIVCLANQLMFDGAVTNPRVVEERQKTFSSCFQEERYDERPFIEEVLRQTGAERNYVFPEPQDLWEELGELIWHQDEPFTSTSIYAQWRVMRLARDRGVKVLLDGQGGDELFAGYLPAYACFARDALRKGKVLDFFRAFQGIRNHQKNGLRRLMLKTLASMIPGPVASILSPWVRDGSEVFKKQLRQQHLSTLPGLRKFDHHLDNYLYEAFRITPLPSLLRYEDRNSMAFSLETRLPFLDYRLVEFAFSLPAGEKIRSGVTKAILREAVRGAVPEMVRNRRDKMGFATPESQWFRTALRGRIEKILHSKSFAERGYFDPKKARGLFELHCEGKVDIGAMIWRWVNLELWLRAFIDQRPSSAPEVICD